MRRNVILATLSAGALFLAFVAPGSVAEAQAARDRLRGNATHLGADPPYPAITIRFQASSDADGSNARGVLSLRSPEIGQRRRGRVTCLNVHGNRATVGIEIVKAEDPTVVGMGELFNVVDNGASGDRIAGFPITATPPTACPRLTFSVPVIAGDYSISDAP
ncbi:MAG: hypothetical protein QOH10_186 [Actinomycetota bacterium]|jgi:hypothetical protein|nr:hypothetical protein [Actinomycetota bacterium]